MTHRCPSPQPALEGREIRPAREGNTSPPWRLAVAVRRNAAGAVEQGGVGLLFRQNGQGIAERSENRQANVPTVAVLDPEQRDLPHDIRRQHAGRELAVNGFGDDKIQDMREAVVEPLAPMRSSRIRVAEDGPHPDFAVTDFGEAGRHVVCPQIEGTATREIEAGVVPVAGQAAILDAAAIQGKAHMWAAIVEREDTTFVVDDEYRTVRPVHDQPPLCLQLLEAARAYEIRGRCVHQQFLSAIVFCCGVPFNIGTAPGCWTLERLAARAISPDAITRVQASTVMPRPLRPSNVAVSNLRPNSR